MKKFSIFILLAVGTFAAKAQTPPYAAIQNFCTTGGQVVQTSGMKSTNTVLATYPKCLVNVYLTGTLTPATIYKDATGTPLGNPFIANADASWIFYVANTGGQAYDITMTGGLPIAFPQPFTLVDVFPNNPGSGGGGGATPAGDPQELNAKLTTSSFQGSGLFTNTAHSYLYTPAPQWAHYAFNSPLSTYAGGRSSGSIDLYGQNQAFLNASGVPTGFGQDFYNYRSGLFTGIGFFNGYSTSNQPSGGSAAKLQNDTAVFHTTAITQTRSAVLVCGKTADCADNYVYAYVHGGYWYGGDEGQTIWKVNGGNQYQRQPIGIVSGNPGTGATTLNFSVTAFDDDWLVEGYVINETAAASNSGNIIAYDTASGLLTTTPGAVTPATATGTTQNAVTVSTMTLAGTTASVTVHVDSGSAFPASGLVYFGCNIPDVEPVNATATPIDGSGNQVLTATFLHGHPSGCKVATPEGSGILDLVADRIGSTWKTGYFVFAAPDNSHIYLRTYKKGGFGVINPWRHNFGTTVPNATVQRVSNVINICNLGQQLFAYNNQYVQVSGAADGTLNGTYKVGILNANYCVTAANTGSDTTAMTATASTGGAVNSPDGTTLGSGGFNIWRAAKIKQVGTTATTVNGITTLAYSKQLILYPNNATWTSGQYAYGIDDMQLKLEGITTALTYDTAPTGDLINAMGVAVAGNGVTGPSFHLLAVQNGNQACMYQGGGNVVAGCNGNMEAPTGIWVNGTFKTSLRLAAPTPLGAAIDIGQSAATDQGVGNNTHFAIRDNGPGGNAGFYVSYNPNAGVSVIGSFTGSGNNQSTITMTPVDFTMNATGAWLASGFTSYRFSSLPGAGTTCATLSATGVLGRGTNCGTVTSVGLSVPSWASVTGSPITASGTLALTLPAFIASGASHAPGVVPDPGGSAGTARYLREDSTWTDPLSGGLSTSFTITTTTGACSFTYTKGLLTTKTGSC